jgi:hypothetical protein
MVGRHHSFVALNYLNCRGSFRLSLFAMLKVTPSEMIVEVYHTSLALERFVQIVIVCNDESK